MTVETLDRTLKELLQLSREDRTYLVENLVVTLDPDWGDEIARRVDDHESGSTRPLEADDVHARLRRKVHEVK